jgi:hypothetical protein
MYHLQSPFSYIKETLKSKQELTAKTGAHRLRMVKAFLFPKMNKLSGL